MASLSERRDASFRLDVGRPDHLGPHLDLGRDAGRKLLRRARDHVVAERGEPLLRVRLREDFGAVSVKDRDNLRGGAGGNKDAQDRKSTRLNSSHLGISYAVFCLKKKKK